MNKNKIVNTVNKTKSRLKQPDIPFYLTCITKPKTSVWHKASPLGTRS